MATTLTTTLNNTLEQAGRFLPKRARQALEQARLMWATGVLRDPVNLIRQLRYREVSKRIQKALFYFRYAQALLAANEIGLLDALLERDRTVAEAAGVTGGNPAAVEQLLRVLEAQGVVRRRAGRFALTPEARFMLAEGPFSIGPILGLMGAQARAFAELPEAIKSGRTPAVLDIFNPEGRYLDFLEAVNSYLAWASRDFLAKVDLPEVRSAIVGSMGVSFSAALQERFPEARITYGCLEHLVREIPRLMESYGVDRERVVDIHAHGGEPSEDRWGDEAFDLVFLTKKMILAPEQRMGEKFAEKALEVLNPGGVAIFWETLHRDDGPTPPVRAMEAVLDLTASPTGPARTEEGIRRLLLGMGYARVEIVPVLGGSSTFVVGYKAA